MSNRVAFALICCGILTGAMNAEARVSAKCLAAVEDSPGNWSALRRVDVEFAAARETPGGDQRSYPVYAHIWYPGNVEGQVALEGTSLVLPAFSEIHVAKFFAGGRVLVGVDQQDPNDPVRWRVQCMQNNRWIDSKYPGAFEPPPELEQLGREDRGTRTKVCSYGDRKLLIRAYETCPLSIPR